MLSEGSIYAGAWRAQENKLGCGGGLEGWLVECFRLGAAGFNGSSAKHAIYEPPLNPTLSPKP